jgi:hypothetical protein
LEECAIRFPAAWERVELLAHQISQGSRRARPYLFNDIMVRKLSEVEADKADVRNER